MDSLSFLLLRRADRPLFAKNFCAGTPSLPWLKGRSDLAKEKRQLADYEVERG